MKWLVFGERGWIGGMVVDLLRAQGEDVVASDGVRVHDSVALADLLDRVMPDRVISTVGRTHGPGYSTIDYLEQKGKLRENLQDNLTAHVLLAEACKQRGIHATILGTGCIFTYDEAHPLGGTGFTDTEPANFYGSAYSTVKGVTDQLMQLLYADKVLHVRIRMPITDTLHPRNFITKITTYDKVCSMANSMTVLPDLLPLMIDMAKQKQTGNINLTNPGVISHNEILELYREIVDPTFTWKNFTYEDQSKVLLSERSNNYLDTTKLESLYPSVTPIREAVMRCLQRIKERCAPR